MRQDSSRSNLNYLDELLSTIQIGEWDWDLSTGKVVYNHAWANILGYTPEELPQTVVTWEKMVLPEDLPYANSQIELHLSGQRPLYEAEFRMVCKDGSVIWAQDKGKVVEFDEDGKPLRFVGVLQNVMRLKTAEIQLRENQATLDLAVNVAGLGTWDWDIINNTIQYNNEYLRMLGYSQEDVNGSMEEWESMNHPEDMPHASELLYAYIDGKIPEYECEIRMKHKDGSYIWTRDVGRVVARDVNGKAIRLIGGHLNIDALKRSEERLTEALAELGHNQLYLENEIVRRTKEVMEQDKVLWTVNQISQRLLVFNPDEDFSSTVQDCLRLLGESVKRNRVYIWRDTTMENGDIYCTQIYEWVKNAVPIQGIQEYEGISYADLPNFSAATNSGNCLNCLVKNLAKSERAVLEPQGIKTILIAPVSINGIRWGFIGVDNCETEMLFTSMEENMLQMSGFMLANTIEKMNTEEKMREAEQRTQILLDATPLCCNLWSPDFKNMSCNEEAVRLFELSSQTEYLERFNELSPEFQPDGQRSNEKTVGFIVAAFREGYRRFEWMHQKLDGTPLPTEVTLVRIKYKNMFIVAGYTRDLRELKATMAELHAKEEALLAARDEALLSSQAKSNFLANMSHEIRTPMNAISGLAEMICRESHDIKSAEYARGIKNASSNLLNIINDILDISKIESGKLEIFNGQYELASLLNDVITISRMRLGDKPVMFITDIDSNLPAHMVGDEIRIKQILINILSNAIKFTHHGHISLRVSGQMIGDQAELVFSVADSGIGIQPDDLKRLFAEFERVNTTKNRTIEGTGLGLAISKQLCEMMGGKIEVESEYEKGSVFTVTIPQECINRQPLAQVQKPKTLLVYETRELYRRSIVETIKNLGCKCISCENQSELYETLSDTTCDFILTPSLHLKKVQTLIKKFQRTVTLAVFTEYGEPIEDDQAYAIYFPINCLQLADLLNGEIESGSFSRQESGGTNFIAPTAHILLVDDNPVNLTVAAGLMEPYQFKIDTAVNGREAVEMVMKQEYDLVFMDHMMPEMDGIDATAEIRRIEGEYFQTLPIVALTANALVGTREMFIREGMNDFLAKPIEMGKLNHVLVKWLPKSKVVTNHAQTTPKPPAETLEWEIAGVDTEKGILSIGGSKENYLQILSIYYKDGSQKSSTLLHQVTEKNFSAFRTDIHALKSASATIGAMELSALAAKLEAAAQSDDVEYIDINIDPFLTKFHDILTAIRPVLNENQQKNSEKSISSNALMGEQAYLQERLEQLLAAVDFVNIGMIEKLLGELKVYCWSEKIQQELTTIADCLAVFDYDGISACVERMRECNPPFYVDRFQDGS